ncbi:MAG TPA: oxidoreductase [Desulfobulbaceae bacterium]|nr:MAG: oxidoreductase [Deltaproteobacteria bacterium RIFOXYD12_FULL_53_23]HCC54448.1 oxidoreductase [Desulfobulbaceae bacterium]
MVNTAVIGCGYWGPNLIRNFMTCPETNLLWACDLDPKRLTHVMAPFPSVQKTTTVANILNDDKVEAVAIATPVGTHYPLAKAALEKGKHVLLEKPLAASVAQGSELVELAAKNDLRLMCDHTFCYTGAVRKIKQIIDAGELGEILYFDSIRINLGLFQSDVNVIWDLATHDLAIVDFLFPEKPIQVSAHGMAHTGNNIENIAYVTLTYPSNFIAHFHVNWLSPVKIRKTIIGGSKKMIEWNDLVPAEKIKVYDKGIELNSMEQDQKSQLMVSYRSGDIHSPQIDGREALLLVAKEFADCITEKRQPLTDGQSALRVLRVLEAAERSIKNDGANVRIEYQ